MCSSFCFNRCQHNVDCCTYGNLIHIDSVADKLAAATGSEVIQVIGGSIVFYKENPDLGKETKKKPAKKGKPLSKVKAKRAAAAKREAAEKKQKKDFYAKKRTYGGNRQANR